VLFAEVDDRTERRRARRVAKAKFPRTKRLAEFNVEAVRAINAAQLATLATGGFMDAGEPIVLLGDSGTGKTHLLIGLGLAACEQGRRIRYVTRASVLPRLSNRGRQAHGGRLYRGQVLFVVRRSTWIRRAVAAAACGPRHMARADPDVR